MSLWVPPATSIRNGGHPHTFVNAATSISENDRPMKVTWTLPFTRARAADSLVPSYGDESRSSNDRDDQDHSTALRVGARGVAGAGPVPVSLRFRAVHEFTEGRE